MKIVFLDFDGVIRLWDQERGRADFRTDLIELLVWACGRTGALVVVTSDWRRERLNDDFEFEDNLDGIAADLGPASDLLHPDWKTPLAGHRWNEVAMWLVVHPEVTDYVILEDFEPHFEGAPRPMLDRLLVCGSRTGLTDRLAKEIVARLGEVSP